MALAGQSVPFHCRLSGRNEPKSCSDVPKYDFNWREHLPVEQAALLAEGLGVALRGPFRQFGQQPRSTPTRPKPVHFGEQTFDEMMVGMYYYALADQNLTLGTPHVKQGDGRSAQLVRPLRADDSGKSSSFGADRRATGSPRVLETLRHKERRGGRRPVASQRGRPQSVPCAPSGRLTHAPLPLFPSLRA